MKKETIEKLIDAIGVKIEELQNTLNAKSQLWLNNGIATSDSVNTWMGKQYRSLEQIQKQLQNIADSYIEEIKEAVKNVYIKELKIINGDISKNIGEDIKLPEEIEKKIQEMTNNLNGQTKLLVDETMKNHQKNIVNVSILANQFIFKNVGVELKIQSTQILYDSIVKATEKGIQNMPKVVLGNGRQMSWKSYIELQARTQLKQEASAYQKESANQLGVIFWLLSSHFDCADDHAPYQGKIYVNRNWESKVQDEELKERIKNFISSKKILFKEQIDEPGGLLERPIEQWNCRHYFEPITIEQALGCSNNQKRDELLESLQMKGGEYDKQNYTDLQQQRYNERKIRQYKTQLQKDELQLMSVPKGVDTEKIKSLIVRDKMFIQKWEGKQEQLLKDNPFLSRDEDREDNTIVKHDLGVRYNKMTQ